jgi:hypothetical protein
MKAMTPKKPRAPRPGRCLTREQILAADHRPEHVRAMEGKRGRRPKWTFGEIEREVFVAVAVELLRMERGIKGARTPSAIYRDAARTKAVSHRAAERFHKLHRAAGREWAYILAMVIPEPRKSYAELVAIYGEKIGKLPAPQCDWIYAYRATLKPSETIDFDRQVRYLLARKK